MTDKTYTKQELEEMTNALLAEDNKKKKAEAKAAEQSQAEAETKEDDKSKEKGKLDDKTIASLPAAALIMANEKLRDMLVKGKKKGKLDSSEVSDVLDEKQADIVTKPGKYEVRFKAVEVFEDITHQLRKWFAGQDDAQDIAAESTTAASSEPSD